MSKAKVILIVSVIGLAAVVAVFYPRWRAAGLVNKDALTVSGNIEVLQTELSFRVPGHVAERPVDEGQAVEAKQLVARLDTRELEQSLAAREADAQAAEANLRDLEAGARPQEIHQAEAAVEQASARLQALEHGSRPQEIAAAQAEVQVAQADVVRLDKDYERYQRLFGQGVISTQQYDAITAAHKAANERLAAVNEKFKLVKEGPRQEDIAQARAALRQAGEQAALVKEGPRKEAIEAAKARVQQARSAAELAKLQLEDATLASPIAGVVLSKNIEPGEYVSPGTPVVTVGHLKTVWLRAYVDETDLGHVKLEQDVDVSTDTFPGKIYHGKISFISQEAEFTPKSVQTEKERVKLVYRVKIDIDNPKMELKPGMPADARIKLG